LVGEEGGVEADGDGVRVRKEEVRGRVVETAADEDVVDGKEVVESEGVEVVGGEEEAGRTGGRTWGPGTSHGDAAGGARGSVALIPLMGGLERTAVRLDEWPRNPQAQPQQPRRQLQQELEPKWLRSCRCRWGCGCVYFCFCFCFCSGLFVCLFVCVCVFVSLFVVAVVSLLLLLLLLLLLDGLAEQ